MNRRIVLVLAVVAACLALTSGASFAAFPGKPGPIAYSEVTFYGEGEATGGIYVHGPRLSEQPRQLTTDIGDHSPSYSPDGRMIVFANGGQDERVHDIYVMRSDGSNRRLVARDGNSPQFLSSGEAIVFVRRVEGRSQIFSIRVDGTGLRQLTHGPGSNYDPAVHPNGRLLAFTSNRRRAGTDLFTMRPAGTRERLLIGGPSSDSDADFSPNGRRLVFTSNRLGPGNIFLARADGRRVRALTRCRASRLRCPSYENPVFSPDGRHVLVLERGGRGSEIRLFRADGRQIRGPSTIDSAGTEEEGFGSRQGPPTWGPRPR